jgi:hypothetical protein
LSLIDNMIKGRKMKKIILIGLLLGVMLLASGTKKSLIPDYMGESTFALIPSITSTITPISPIPTTTPKPTGTLFPTGKTIESYDKYFPLEQKIKPFTREQVEEVKQCNMKDLSKIRYRSFKRDLINLFEPKTACDWAVLAYTSAPRDDAAISDQTRDAFGQALLMNPAFVFSEDLYYVFSCDTSPIVEQPSAPEEAITHVTIAYQWSGIGDPVAYTIDIYGADEYPYVALSHYEPISVASGFNTTLDKEIVQALAKAINNPIPIQTQFTLQPCYDNIPDWVVTLTFKDESQLIIRTNESNVVFRGGPWQTTIDGQDYLLYSLGFNIALDKVIKAIGVPYGSPQAMYCSPLDVISLAYPAK